MYIGAAVSRCQKGMGIAQRLTAFYSTGFACLSCWCGRKENRTVVLLLSLYPIGRPKAEASTLAKRATNSAQDSIEGRGKNHPTPPDYGRMSAGEKSGVVAGFAVEREDGTSDERAKPSMREVFGPEGVLEKCMRGGCDRAVVSSDYAYRPAPLDSADMGQEALGEHHHAMLEPAR